MSITLESNKLDFSIRTSTQKRLKHIKKGHTIEEGLNQKTRQRSLRRIGGQNPCCSCCFALVFLKQMVEFYRLFQKDRG